MMPEDDDSFADDSLADPNMVAINLSDGEEEKDNNVSPA